MTSPTSATGSPAPAQQQQPASQTEAPKTAAQTNPASGSSLEQSQKTTNDPKAGANPPVGGEAKKSFFTKIKDGLASAFKKIKDLFKSIFCFCCNRKENAGKSGDGTQAAQGGDKPAEQGNSSAEQPVDQVSSKK